MNITISTTDRALLAALHDNPFGLTFTPMTGRGGKGADSQLLYEFGIVVAQLGVTIAANLFSQWLYEKIKGRCTRINIDGVKTGVEAAEIQRTIENVKETHRDDPRAE